MWTLWNLFLSRECVCDEAVFKIFFCNKTVYCVLLDNVYSHNCEPNWLVIKTLCFVFYDHNQTLNQRDLKTISIFHHSCCRCLMSLVDFITINFTHRLLNVGGKIKRLRNYHSFYSGLIKLKIKDSVQTHISAVRKHTLRTWCFFYRSRRITAVKKHMTIRRPIPFALRLFQLYALWKATKHATQTIRKIIFICFSYIILSQNAFYTHARRTLHTALKKYQNTFGMCWS